MTQVYTYLSQISFGFGAGLHLTHLSPTHSWKSWLRSIKSKITESSFVQCCYSCLVTMIGIRFCYLLTEHNLLFKTRHKTAESVVVCSRITQSKLTTGLNNHRLWDSRDPGILLQYCQLWVRLSSRVCRVRWTSWALLIPPWTELSIHVLFRALQHPYIAF